jgi:hypothetical protein
MTSVWVTTGDNASVVGVVFTSRVFSGDSFDVAPLGAGNCSANVGIKPNMKPEWNDHLCPTVDTRICELRRNRIDRVCVFDARASVDRFLREEWKIAVADLEEVLWEEAGGAFGVSWERVAATSTTLTIRDCLTYARAQWSAIIERYRVDERRVDAEEMCEVAEFATATAHVTQTDIPSNVNIAPSHMIIP